MATAEFGTKPKWLNVRFAPLLGDKRTSNALFALYASHPRALVIADVPSNLAAKDPIGPTRVHQDHRQQHKRADQKKRLGSPGGRGLPQGEMVGNDHRVETDGDAEIRQDKESDRARER